MTERTCETPRSSSVQEGTGCEYACDEGTRVQDVAGGSSEIARLAYHGLR